MCGGWYQVAPHVRHCTVRWPSLPGEQLHGFHAMSALGCTRRCPFTQMFGNHSETAEVFACTLE